MSVLNLNQERQKVIDFIQSQSGDNLIINVKINELDPKVYEKFENLQFKKVKFATQNYSLNLKVRDFVQYILQCSIPCDYLKLFSFLEYDRTKKYMKLSINQGLYNGSFKKTKADVLGIEKIKICLIKSGSIYQLKEIVQYLLSFPSLRQLIIDLTHLKYSSNLIEFEKAAEFLKPLEKIDDILILQNKFNICKKNKQIVFQQIISTQKEKVESLRKIAGMDVVQSINRIIDLTNKNNVNKDLLQESCSNVELLDKPKVIKLFGNLAFFKGTITLLEKFKRISTLIVLFKKQGEEKEQPDLLEGFRQMSERINQLKHFEVIDSTSFLERHNSLIKILLEKHYNFKVTYSKNKQFLQYIPSERFLKIRITEPNSVSESEIQEIFKLYRDANKISLNGDVNLIQFAIKLLAYFPNITCIKFICTFYEDKQLDFSPLYQKKELHKIKFFYEPNSLTAGKQLYFKSIKSLCDHPTCTVIKGKDFTFSHSSKRATLKVESEEYMQLFEKTIKRFNQISIINILPPIDNLDFQFLIDIITLPCLQTILLNSLVPQLSDLSNTNQKPFKTLQDIIVQKLRIISIQKCLSEFIPVYLPQLIYDLYTI
ncbi:hypothetical protein ABPG72_001749 [Tetrahymena utriculariae]